ncbi:hypothetical protein D3C73_1257530 [compost metagenome]
MEIIGVDQQNIPFPEIITLPVDSVVAGTGFDHVYLQRVMGMQPLIMGSDTDRVLKKDWILPWKQNLLSEPVFGKDNLHPHSPPSNVI